jgi:hypothetical protein
LALFLDSLADEYWPKADMPRPRCLRTSDSTFCLAFANNDSFLRAVPSPFRSFGDFHMTNLGVLERSGFDGVYSYLRNLGKIINHAVLPREENMFYLCSQIIKESPAAEYLKVQNKHSINADFAEKTHEVLLIQKRSATSQKTRSYCICKTLHSE